MKGVTEASAAPTSTPYSTTRHPILLIDHPLAGQPVLEHGQEQDGREQDERQRRGVAVAVALIELLEDQHAGGRGRATGPALGQDVDVVERLEGPDHGED